MGDNNTRNSVMLQASNSYVEKIRKFADDVQINFTEYQKECVVNAVRAINPMIEQAGYAWNSFGIDNIMTVLQQTAFLGLNPSATPRECYYIIRKNWDNSNGQRKPLPPTIEFGVEGAGNDIILRNFGQDVKDIKSYIVYKGDEFTEGYMDGWNMTLPKYKRTFKTNIPEKVVYLIKKNNDEIDVQYADTEDVKKSLLANARQNGADEKLLRQLNKLGLYDILNNEEWIDYKIQKKYGNKTYETPLFNPSYTSVISMYNMIERKLRNHATRKYPKNFNVKEVSNLYEETFEEKYDEKGNVILPKEIVESAEQEFEEKAGSEEIVTVEEDTRPTLENNFESEDEETLEESEYSTEEETETEFEIVEEPQKEQEEVVEEQTETTETEESVDDEDDPFADWDE